MRNFIAARDTRKETAIPIIRTAISGAVAEKPAATNFTIFRSEAPSITGIAMKNENSALAVLDTPTSIPPIIVEPERDVPGMSDST